MGSLQPFTQTGLPHGVEDRRYKHRVFLFIIQRPAGSAKMEVRLIRGQRYLFNFLKYLTET